MNRRSFFSALGTAAAGFMILPGAGRVWAAPRTDFSFWAEGSQAEIWLKSEHFEATMRSILDKTVGIPTVPRGAKAILFQRIQNINAVEHWCLGESNTLRNTYAVVPVRDAVMEAIRRGHTVNPYQFAGGTHVTGQAATISLV